MLGTLECSDGRTASFWDFQGHNKKGKGWVLVGQVSAVKAGRIKCMIYTIGLDHTKQSQHQEHALLWTSGAGA